MYSTWKYIFCSLCKEPHALVYLVRCLISLNEYSGSSKWLILICFRLYRRTHVVFPSSSSPLRTFLFGAGDAGEILEKEPGPNHFVAYWQLALSFSLFVGRKVYINCIGDCGYYYRAVAGGVERIRKKKKKKRLFVAYVLRIIWKVIEPHHILPLGRPTFFFLFSLRFAKGGNQESKLRKWR